ncbi:hypothetical protein SCG7109_AE_00130 [Chlamydiales bacterium SCGC AG-110-M15]|nr:hypothetical protein SCG7109_AE_00130 [Chlamydiales bacterium SCGC AG-110-M15]
MENQYPTIALADIWAILKRAKKSIIFFSLLAGLTLSTLILKKSPQFEATATFQEGKIHSSAQDGSLSNLLSLSGANENSFSELIVSRKALTPVIKSMSLQAIISKIGGSSSLIRNISENLIITRAELSSTLHKELVIPDTKEELRCTDVEYLGEYASGYLIHFEGGDSFSMQASDKSKPETYRGRLGEPLQGKDFNVTIEKAPSYNGQLSSYSLALQPFENVVNQLKSSIEIESRINADNLYDLTFKHRDRHFAAKVLNQLMNEYTALILFENQERTKHQLAYLQKRQDEASEKHNQLLEEHCDYLSHNIQNTGFTMSQEGQMFLASNNAKWINELNKLDIDQEFYDGIFNNTDLEDKTHLLRVGTTEKGSFKNIVSRLQALSLQKKSLENQLSTQSKLSEDELNDLKLALNITERRIAVLEKQVDHETRSLEGKAKKQKTLVESMLGNLNSKMSNFPEQWLRENRMSAEERAMSSSIENVSKLVESTIISHNLEMLESKALDLAVPPTYPLSPRLILFLAIGSIFGAFVTASIALFQAYPNKLAASPENLNLLKLPVLSKLSHKIQTQNFASLSNKDQGTLRKIIRYLSQETPSQVLLCACNNGANFAPFICELLAKQSEKVLLISYVQRTENENGPLLAYLEGNTNKLSTQNHRNGYDIVEERGKNPFAVELMSSKRFKELLQDLKQEYDRIVITVDGSPMEPRVLNLKSLVDRTALKLMGEPLQDLQAYTETGSGSVGFLF